MNKQISIIGTGLIGGSLAKALRKSGFARTIVGADQDEAALQTAVARGVIDRYSTDPIGSGRGLRHYRVGGAGAADRTGVEKSSPGACGRRHHH